MRVDVDPGWSQGWNQRCGSVDRGEEGRGGI